MALLAFFALRPGKGWLRHNKAAAPTLGEGSSGNDAKLQPDAGAKVDTFLPGSPPKGGSPAEGLAVAPPDGMLPLPHLHTASVHDNDTSVDTFLPASRSTDPPPTAPTAALDSKLEASHTVDPSVQHAPDPLPHSYLSSVGGWRGAAIAPAASQTASLSSR